MMDDCGGCRGRGSSSESCPYVQHKSLGPDYNYQYYYVNKQSCNSTRLSSNKTGCDLTFLPTMHSLANNLWSILVILIIICSLNPVRCQGIAEEGRAMKYLGTFGYISGPSTETGNYIAKEDFKKALKHLQMMGGIPQTGEPDQRTLELMSKPRCGVRDEVDSKTTSNRRGKRYVLAPSKWDKKDLTYRILNYTPDLHIEKVRKAIYDAFTVWSDATDLTFTETTASYADIMIKFASGYHQDGYPFDGKGLILAHAFFPGEDKGGDTHFDDDEKWILNSKEDGVDLFMVAAHEFGHALGLGHSSEPKALMYPWYQGFDENFKLPNDDIEGIQRLYGGRGPLPRPRPPVTRPRHRTTTRAPKVVTKNPPYRPKDDDNKKTPAINPCEHRFDAISVLRREVFLFMGDTFYRLDSRGLIQGEPTKIHSFWYGLPKWVNKIDAVFERTTDGKIIIFIGDKYWVFNGNQRLGPESGRPLADFGIPADIKRLDAVFVWGFNNRTYLISGDMYWKLNLKNDYIELDYPRDMSIWRNVPTPVDAAFRYWDGKTYFFKGEYYYEFYDNYMKVRKGFPKLIRKHWLGCNTDPQGQYNLYRIQNQPAVDDKQKNIIENGTSDIKSRILTLCVLSFVTSLLYVLQ